MNIKWIWKKFNELTTLELYQAIALRELVFVVGQNCVYLDCDDQDQKAMHLLGYITRGANDFENVRDEATGLKNQSKDVMLVAYLRAFPPGVKYKESAFGRVATSPDFRGQGFGKALTQEALLRMENAFGKGAVRISAQAYLQKFYEGFGFTREGEIYDEVGIPHIEMVRK